MSYGFVADPTLSTHHNASIQIAKMFCWFFFTRPQNIAFHDLTSTSTPVPKNIRSLLGLGLKFCPVQHKTPSQSANFDRFRRNLLCKTFFAKDETESDPEYEAKFYVNTDWEPPDFSIPDSVLDRLNNFETKMKLAYKSHRRSTVNLLPCQQYILRQLQTRHDLLVVHCDKNLGPAIIEKDKYINLCYKNHLSNSATYQRLTQTEADLAQRTIADKIISWMSKYRKDTTLQERKFINHGLTHHQAFPVFYQTMKVHQHPSKTRPVISTSGSLLFNIGIWVDHYLQQVANMQTTVLKSSRVLKLELEALDLPPNAFLFTADAVGMYTNINTKMALWEIGNFLQSRSRSFPTIPFAALSEAIGIVMQHNVFQFGDTYWLQKVGTAMGTPPGPSYANLFFAIKEKRMLPKHPNIIYYR